MIKKTIRIIKDFLLFVQFMVFYLFYFFVMIPAKIIDKIFGTNFLGPLKKIVKKIAN
ncbi:MAG: hypothetical protein HQK51_10840 [Oligoflexia bacterium]|nr:hypothetical protein [Oligoflexia bacterium]